ncbi:hypothetical protein HNP40_004001 [Mycobacteroides chelonae]|nr:hypothetical protein [Mycobacteroides chelonae]
MPYPASKTPTLNTATLPQAARNPCERKAIVPGVL